MQQRESDDLARITWESPIGWLAVAAHSQAVVEVHFNASGGEAASAGAAARALCREARREITAYLAGDLRRFTVPIDARGSDFQRAVWAAISAIPYGRTLAYGELAARLGKPLTSRAVGGACGANPIPLIIPCHRVLAANGRLGGFGGGRELKSWLLELESGCRSLPFT
ncbi:MAG: methylated-DNA--[protein]-cysteine S-methyltransferase [bacterium]|nr:methylated-DNA--[protein]-cysteine S-methyltransferase [bacterium]